jgi:uncharacterized protein YukE
VQGRSEVTTPATPAQARSAATTTGTTQARSAEATTPVLQARSAATTTGTTQARSAEATTTGTTQDADAQSFKVDLEDMESSITLVQSRANSIDDEYTKIRYQFFLVSHFGAWSSPAGDTFTPVVTQLVNAMSVLQELLVEIVSMMRQTYDNYVQAETTNVQILTS